MSWDKNIYSLHQLQVEEDDWNLRINKKKCVGFYLKIKKRIGFWGGINHSNLLTIVIYGSYNDRHKIG